MADGHPNAITAEAISAGASGYWVVYDRKAHLWRWHVWQDHLQADGTNRTGAGAFADIRRAWDEFSTRLL